MRLKLKSRVFTAAVAVALVGGALVATGVATATTPSTTYYACLRTAGGTLYNVNSTGSPKCLGKDLAISWNQKGPAGANGTNGKTILNGTTTPASTIGTNGDFYLDTATHTLYGPKANGTWPTAGTSLVGPQGLKGANGATGATGAMGATGGQGATGPAGANGAQGPAGTNGNTVLNGAGAPASGVGNDGDFYLDTATETLYGPKAGGTWPTTGTSLVGPQGPAGATGATGPAGSPPQPDLSRVATLDWWGGSYSGGSYGFNEPDGIAFDGTHIWATNWSGDSVSELDASDGDLVQTFSGGSYGFNEPDGVAFDGTHIWVANYAGDSVTELDASDGDLVQTLSNASYGFNSPRAVA